ncbi:transcriptional antiterminator, BglG family [Halobacillus karajensis]|uniref:Levansucrase and sucrase synthesis operon antiterminator n=1 Tax=Halobacillus karajensis TaxID=195088 RepID=A0A059NZ85_9BACI|nr:PRD domain-containing protein [Halobacillus karajensis]CDQ18531.1 Levansucrase and sucrase synthesis operon antiterminator [Halobacillus karajensis]CDQ23397.1 Levansucrase and sucrase synthesis operon antiterminator [Halobacillus karajensis]CDQ26879.1 Levansucrase and sucrase synthesis operon antiterminator [Halobacillus karajensis]SEH50296.1 transcriptional antiterminator, BglG family [Halobacillus karajensis]
MRISKILNNNAVVVYDGPQEKIVMGKGVAFQKKRNDIVPKHKIEKIFLLRDQSSEKFQQLLSTLPEKHIEVAERIISYAEGYLEAPLHDHIHIALTDHLSFALERIGKGFPIQNKLTNEIKFLYKKEFEVGMWAKEEIKQKLGVDIPLDEVAHIALHVHTAKMDAPSMNESLQTATILRDFIDQVEEIVGVPIEETSINYQRLITHLRFALNRVEEGSRFEPMDEDMMTLIQMKYEEAYKTSKKVTGFLRDVYGIDFPDSEIAYIALHIQRLLTK